MLPIKKVLNLKHELSTFTNDVDHSNLIAEAIILALPQFDNKLENVYLTYHRSILNKNSGEILKYDYFLKNADIGLIVQNIINDKKSFKKTQFTSSLINPIKVLDINEDYNSLIDRDESVAKILIEALPEFDNKYENINLTYPYNINNRDSGHIIGFNYLSQNYLNFQKINQHLSKHNSENKIKFIFNSETGVISETKAFGAVYIGNTLSNNDLNPSERAKFLQDVYSAIDDLILQLPKNIKDIKEFHMYDYTGSIQESFSRPLLTLINKTRAPEILDFIFKKYPQYKEYYNLNSKYYEEDETSRVVLGQSTSPLWYQHYYNLSHDSREEYLYVYYTNGLIDKNDLLLKEGEFDSFCTRVFKQAIFKNDRDFIKNELSNPDTLQIIINNNQYATKAVDLYEYPTRFCTDLETLKILKEYKIPFFSTINDNYSYQLITNSEAENLFKSILDKNIKSEINIEKLLPIHAFSDPNSYNFYNNLKNLCEVFPDFRKTEIISNFAESILQHTHLKDLESLFTEFSSIDYTGIDVFSYILKKRTDTTLLYSLAIEAGADPRNCEDFIERIVKNREEGLKLLRALNKEGIVVVKNPDYVFYVYKSNPTKNFITYFDKTPDEVFSKYTANGNIVWWGAESIEQIKSKLYKVKDITQNSKDGRSLFHYFAHKEHTNPKQLSFENLIKVIFGPKFYKENQEFDLSYIYPNGNNLVHELLTFSVFKTNINISGLNILDEYSKFDLAEQFSQKNNNGYTPIELMLKQYHDRSDYVLNMSTNISRIVNHFGNRIDYTQKLQNGNELIEEIKNYLPNEEKIMIESYYIEQMIPKNDIHIRTNMKKF